MTTDASKPASDLNRPQGKFTKRLLPPALSSQTLHGPINKASRSEGEQAALDKRKNEILQSMTKEQIDAAYSGQAVKINEHLQKKVKKDDEITGQLTQLKAEHEMEIRVIKASLTRQDEKKGESGGAGMDAGKAEDAEKKSEMQVDDQVERNEDDGKEDGEIEMTG